MSTSVRSPWWGWFREDCRSRRQPACDGHEVHERTTCLGIARGLMRGNYVFLLFRNHPLYVLIIFVRTRFRLLCFTVKSAYVVRSSAPTSGTDFKGTASASCNRFDPEKLGICLKGNPVLALLNG